MRFWIRHVFLLVLCVVLPAVAALYFDATLGADQSAHSGATAARLAGQALRGRLTLAAHRSVSGALGLAQNLRDQDALANIARGRPGAFESAREALAAVAPAGGFAWLVDAEGHIVVAHDMEAAPETPRSIAGHPIYIQTELGYALDGFWSVSEPVVMVAAAPIAEGPNAAGAVLIGRQADASLAAAIAQDIEAQVTLVAGGEPVVTTLDGSAAQDVVAATKDTLEPVLAGRLAEPLSGGALLPFLPLFVDHYAEGLAYSSSNVSIPGVRQDLYWVVTVRISDGLEGLAERQEIILGVVIASLLLALLIGLLNFRTFVTPIDRVSAHLSEIQLGRGDLELPEARVSKPFRRLVRLINMTVQKMPARPLSSIGSELSPVQDLAPRAQSGLQLSRPDQVPAPPPVPMPPPAASSAPDFVPMLDPVSMPAPAAQPSLPPPPVPSLPPDVPPRYEADFEPEDESDEQGDEDAIAAAIAALESSTGPVKPPPRAPTPTPTPIPSPMAPVRSASSIRGASPFEIDEGSHFGRGGSQVGRPAAQGGVRGGGSLDLSGHAGIEEGGGYAEVGSGEFNPEATVVAPVQEALLARSAQEDFADAAPDLDSDARPDHTVVASVPPDLLAQSAREGTAEVRSLRGASQVVRDEQLDASDRAHFKEVYERFIDMRRRCGENTGDLAFDRFLAKLTRNRDNLVKKYACRTVRFQVYEKDGKAALKATPVRAR